MLLFDEGIPRVLGPAFCEVLEVRDGKITRGQVYFDLATMMRQLGLA